MSRALVALLRRRHVVDIVRDGSQFDRTSIGMGSSVSSAAKPDAQPNRPLFLAVRLTWISHVMNIGPAMISNRVALAVLFAVAACGGEPVGRICDLGTALPQAGEVV